MNKKFTRIINQINEKKTMVQNLVDRENWKKQRKQKRAGRYAGEIYLLKDDNGPDRKWKTD